MTDLQEKAMRMALDALTVQTPEHWLDKELQEDAIQALRQALSNEFNPDWNQVEALQESLREHMAEIQRLRQALEQPKQEPIKYKCTIIDDEHPNGIPLEQWGNTSPPHYWGNVTNAELVEELRRRGMMESLYPEQEPVAAVVSWDKSMITQLAEYVAPATLLYTAPPSIEAAVLAEREACAKVCDDLAEIHEQMNQWGSHKTADALAQAIRARSEK